MDILPQTDRSIVSSVDCWFGSSRFGSVVVVVVERGQGQGGGGGPIPHSPVKTVQPSTQPHRLLIRKYFTI